MCYQLLTFFLVFERLTNDNWGRKNNQAILGGRSSIEELFGGVLYGGTKIAWNKRVPSESNRAKIGLTPF